MARIIVVGFLVFIAHVAAPAQSQAQGACTRADLQSAVDSYLTSQRSGNPKLLPLASTARYIENTEASAFDKGILKTPLKIDFNRSLLDTAICETFTEVIVTDMSHPYVLGVRIKVTDRKISELETLVTDADDWLFNADNYLKYSPAENWGVIPATSETGSVVGFIRWPSGVPDSHLFRVENGKLRFVHSLTVCTVPNCGFPQRAPATGR